MGVSREDILKFGFIDVVLFDSLYPNGTTIEQMEQDAAEHGWLRAILPNLTAKREAETAVDLEEVAY